MSERIARQSIARGWDQNALEKSSIVVVGSNNLADLLVTDFLAMEFGRVEHIGTSSIPFLDLPNFNPHVKSQFYESNYIDQSQLEAYVSNPTFLIDATSSLNEKIEVLSFVAKHDLNAYTALATTRGFTFSQVDKNTPLDSSLKFQSQLLENSPNSSFNAIIGSGMLSNEVRKHISPMDGDELIQNYKVFSTEKKEDTNNILVIGAGGTGNFTSMSLALQGYKADVIDFDVVEESNLSRQVLFYESLGESKAIVLAEKLNWVGINDSFTQNFVPAKKYDILFSCVDNSKARVHANHPSG